MSTALALQLTANCGQKYQLPCCSEPRVRQNINICWVTAPSLTRVFRGVNRTQNGITREYAEAVVLCV